MIASERVRATTTTAMAAVVVSRLCVLLCGCVLGVVLLASLGPASASAASGWWDVLSMVRPAGMQPGVEGTVVVSVANLGDATIEGSVTPISVTDTLPVGLKAVACSKAQVKKEEQEEKEGTRRKGQKGCGITASAGEGLTRGTRGTVFCPTGEVLEQVLTCTFEGPVPAYDQIELYIHVRAEESLLPGESNSVSVSGGGAPERTVSQRVSVDEDGSFGVEYYSTNAEEEGGSVATQAGAHPFQVTGDIVLRQNEMAPGDVQSAADVELPKTLNGLLPAGLIGNPTPLAKCTLKQFLALKGAFENECPQNTAVGMAMIGINEPTNFGIVTLPTPIFNIEPATGEPARFGFILPATPIILDTSVRTGSDYGITLGSNNIPQDDSLLAFRLTFWGIPGDQRHDLQRGEPCIEVARENTNAVCHVQGEAKPLPFISMPTACLGALGNTLEAASWLEPGSRLFEGGEPTHGLDGCNRLSFEPSIHVAPDSSQGVTPASTPTGLGVDVHVPQSSILESNGLAESNVKGITVTLPEGVAVNPASGDGLAVCSESEIGYTGNRELNPLAEPGVQTAQFTREVYDPTTRQEVPSLCPDASKIATATIHTPLLPNPLTGQVYLAAETQNPFGSLFAMYLLAEDRVSGTIVKLTGEVSLNPATGQITTTFKSNPQLAFEDAELHFFGGPRAPLVTPAHCGDENVTSAVFVPWSGQPAVSSQSSFQVNSGPNQSGCPGGVLPYAPSATAGAINIQAGSFAQFTTTMSRPDGNQNLKKVTFKLPTGLSGILSGVKLCGEPQASLGQCSAESQIGETTVSVGVGPDPYSVKGGRVYITGPFNGSGACTPGESGCAPFGLSIVNPVNAGPIDLAPYLGSVEKTCDCLVVRAKLEVDPRTAALTVTTNPIPSMLAGVPLEIQHVNVIVNRPNFTFNPTDCASKQIGASIESWEQGQSAQSIPFQVTNCATLKFAPQFSVTTQSKTSKADGASLTVKLSQPSAPFGTLANIGKVKVELPKQLPSRLTTLQKACTAAQFDANPAGCPAASVVGHATVHTPILPVPLEGPAYFVSNGGEAFPNLIIVLQGYGVKVELVGDTFIDSKTGITSSTFKEVPDVPFNIFELTLPEGPYSALAANTNLCAQTVKTRKRVTARVHGRTVHRTQTITKTTTQSLTMPTEFLAQNGTPLHQNTKIAVTGCPKTAKQQAKKGKHSRKHGKKR